MAISFLNEDVSIISRLADKPNETNGLSADQLKARFDEAAEIIKLYLNSVVVPEVNSLGEGAEDLETALNTAVSGIAARFVLAESAISGHTSDIADNAQAISDNAQAISENAGDISALDGDLSDLSAATKNIEWAESGTLPVVRGGTGAATAAAARTNFAVPYKPVLLWSGTWSSGSLTVAKSGGSSGCTGLGNLSEYDELLIVPDSSSTYICPFYVHRDNAHSIFYGGCNLSIGENAVRYSSFADLAVSNNVLTMNALYRWRWASSESTNLSVGAIYGTRKNADIITS